MHQLIGGTCSALQASVEGTCTARQATINCHCLLPLNAVRCRCISPLWARNRLTAVTAVAGLPRPYLAPEGGLDSCALLINNLSAEHAATRKAVKRGTDAM